MFILIAAVVLGVVFVLLREREQAAVSLGAFQNSKSFQEMKERFIRDFHEIQGTITNITNATTTGQVLTVETSIPDPSTLGTAEHMIPTKNKKVIKISISKNTVVTSQALFKAGDVVDAILDQSVYFASEFNALKISLYSRELAIRQAIGYSDVIHGTVKSIDSGSFVLQAKVADLSKLAALNVSQSFTVPQVTKNYTIFVTAKTAFSNVSFAGLKMGDSVTAWGNDNLLNKNSFTASRVRKEK